MGKDTGKKKVLGKKSDAEQNSKLTRREKMLLYAASILIKEKVSDEQLTEMFDLIKSIKAKKVPKRKAG